MTYNAVKNVIFQYFTDESEKKPFIKDIVKAEKFMGRHFDNYAEYALYTFDGTSDDIWRFKEQFWRSNTLFSNDVDYVVGLDVSKFINSASDECVKGLLKWIKANSSEAIVIFFMPKEKNTQALKKTIDGIFAPQDLRPGGVKK
jgi:hypothetical protein